MIWERQFAVWKPAMLRCHIRDSLLGLVNCNLSLCTCLAVCLGSGLCYFSRCPAVHSVAA